MLESVGATMAVKEGVQKIVEATKIADEGEMLYSPFLSKSTGVEKIPFWDRPPYVDQSTLSDHFIVAQIPRESIIAESGTYGHMAGNVQEFFKGLGATDVKIEPTGQTRVTKVDLLAVDREGNPIIGEIVSNAEASTSIGSWWSSWKGKLENVYSDAAESLSSSARGWCAKIDGQLRTYCENLKLRDGYVVVEKYNAYAGQIKESLEYLKHEGRIQDYEVLGLDTAGNGYIEIRFS
ncbi:MAG: hypothetical protein WCO53_14565 [Deltaproteobacteria bacterium]